jgi:DNA-binding IclR family transcriptional regulator
MPMKEFKLSAWPDLPAPYQRMTYRRMLSEMSLRYVSVPQLITSSGASRTEARTLLQLLAERGLLDERDAPRGSLRAALRPLAAWLRRAIDPGR